jgi:hypothetical protein
VKQLVKEAELLQVVRISSRLLRDLRARRVIPFVKLNSKVVLYDPDRILKVLAEYERMEAGTSK